LYRGLGFAFEGSWMEGAGRSVGIIMGSQSDWDTMQHAAGTLDRLGIGYETRIVSAHRTPDRLFDYARTAKSRGLRLIIAGAGGGSHLHGKTAALTPLPVIGVQIENSALKGEASLMSIIQLQERSSGCTTTRCPVYVRDH